MAKQKRPRHRRSPLAAALRYPVLLFTYTLLLPTTRVIDKLGYTQRVLTVIGRQGQAYLRLTRNFGSYTPTRHDVIVCAYFKSGTNWAMQIAHQIATRGRGEFDHIHDVIPWPDEVKRGYSIPLEDEAPLRASPTGLRVIKTHMEWEYVPYTPEARYIWLLRDPKDVFVSSYHFIRDVLFGPLMPGVSAWLDFYLSPGFLMGTWTDHLQGYWHERHRSNILFLTFKEMKADLPGCIGRIADFMGVELSGDEFDLVCEKSSFRYMKRIDHKFYPGILSPWSCDTGRMLRKGRHGGSSELLALEQQQRIDAYCQDVLKRLQCDFPYDEFRVLAR